MRSRQIALSTPINVDKNVMIVGCGGVGWHTATILAMAEVRTLALVDHDIITLDNLNRLPVPKEELGQYKVDVLAKNLRQLPTRSYIYAYNTVAHRHSLYALLYTMENALNTRTDVIISAVDNDYADAAVLELCKLTKAKYIRIAYEDHLISFCTRQDQIVPNTMQGYMTVPSWAGGAYIAAGLAAYLALVDNQTDNLPPTNIDIIKLVRGEGL